MSGLAPPCLKVRESSTYADDALLEAFETHLGGRCVSSSILCSTRYGCDRRRGCDVVEKDACWWSRETMFCAPSNDDEEYSIRMWLSSRERKMH